MSRALISVLPLALLAACETPREVADSSEPPLSAASATSKLGIDWAAMAAEYRQWPKAYANWSPSLCRLEPMRPTMSRSADPATHGRKIYDLYVRNAWAHATASINPQPIGQTLVKETWSPRLHTLNDTQLSGIVGPDGQRYVKSDQGDLFIMTKLDPATPETDAGWVYAVVKHDGSWIFAEGRIENCMSCHIDAGPDRVFGPPQPGADTRPWSFENP